MKPSKPTTKPYTRRSASYKEEALKLADRTGYQQLIQQHQLRGSMSAKGNCYDNACAESFFHSMKVECIHGERFATRDAMKQTVFEYIETDYNRHRLHSTLGYLSPLGFEAQFLTN